jgi:hypothetical protein
MKVGDIAQQDVRYPGDLCTYMSRVVLVIEKIDDDWCLCQEIGETGFRKIREDILTMIQPA